MLTCLLINFSYQGNRKIDIEIDKLHSNSEKNVATIGHVLL